MPEPEPVASVPIALAWGPGDLLHVAERDGRCVDVVDPRHWRVVGRWELPLRPHSIVYVPELGKFLVGGQDGDLLVASGEGQVEAVWNLGRGPASVLPLRGSKVIVGCRWDRRVRVVELTTGIVEAEHALKFCPGPMIAVPGGRVIVADSFGGMLAELEPGQVGSERERALGGFQVRGLALSGDRRELVAVQMTQLTSERLTRSNLDWGVILSSKLVALRLSEFERSEGQGSPVYARRLPLDGSGHGAADPSATVVSGDGLTVLVTLAGAHQVLKIDRGFGQRTATDLLPLGDSLLIEEFETGQGPVDLVLDRPGTLAITADSMSDTLTVFDVETLSHVATVPLGPGATAGTLTQRGEAGFRDGRASLDRWMSCASCHTDGHTNGLSYDTLGDSDYGSAKQTPSLLGVGSTAPYSWSGKFARLEDQVEQSLRTTLHGKNPEPARVAEISAYLHSLQPPAQLRSAEEPGVVRGAELFRSRRCVECHESPTWSSKATYDVGTGTSRESLRRFNPPSLRGVGWGAPYLHDGRARTLEAVVEQHHPGTRADLTAEQVCDLVAYLESL